MSVSWNLLQFQCRYRQDGICEYHAQEEKCSTIVPPRASAAGPLRPLLLHLRRCDAPTCVRLCVHGLAVQVRTRTLVRVRTNAESPAFHTFAVRACPLLELIQCVCVCIRLCTACVPLTISHDTFHDAGCGFTVESPLHILSHESGNRGENSLTILYRSQTFYSLSPSVRTLCKTHRRTRFALSGYVGLG